MFVKNVILCSCKRDIIFIINGKNNIIRRLVFMKKINFTFS